MLAEAERCPRIKMIPAAAGTRLHSSPSGGHSAISKRLENVSYIKIVSAVIKNQILGPDSLK